MDFSKPHRRLNPLTNEFVLVSPHRAKRPWLGQTEQLQIPCTLHYDPECYLCPGNARVGGQRNPVFDHTFSFSNDFSAVLWPEEQTQYHAHPLLVAEPVHGACDVVVFHPKHDLSFPRMKLQDIEHILDEWIRIYSFRGSQNGIKYVQIFENKGLTMGCSNPHPHGQIWSLSEVPTLPSVEIASFQRYSLLDSISLAAPKGPKGIIRHIHIIF